MWVNTRVMLVSSLVLTAAEEVDPERSMYGGGNTNKSGYQ